MKTKTLWTALVLSVAPAFTAAAADGPDRWQLGTASSLSTGNYGSLTSTKVVHTPFMIRRLFADGDLTLIVPMTCVDGNGDVTVVDGRPARTEQNGTGRTTSTDATTGRTTVSTTRTASANVPQTVCGVGDLVVRGRYYLLDEAAWFPTVALRAHVKLPTASVTRGLGTGRSDEGVGVETTKTIGQGLAVMLDAGFTFVGEPSDVTYNNAWWYAVGLGRDLTPHVNVSAFYEHDRAIVTGFEDARDVLAAVSVKGPNGWRFQGSALFGLSSGAPARGMALGASRRF